MSMSERKLVVRVDGELLGSDQRQRDKKGGAWVSHVGVAGLFKLPHTSKDSPSWTWRGRPLGFKCHPKRSALKVTVERTVFVKIQLNSSQTTGKLPLIIGAETLLKYYTVLYILSWIVIT